MAAGFLRAAASLEGGAAPEEAVDAHAAHTLVWDLDRTRTTPT